MKRTGSKRGATGAFLPRPQHPDLIPRGKLRWQHLLAAAAVAVIVAALTREPQRRTVVAEDIDTSVVSKEDIRASFFFESVDLQETQAAQKAAAENVPNYYRIDRAAVEEELSALETRVARIARHRPDVTKAVLEALKASAVDQPKQAVVEAAVNQYVSELKGQAAEENLPEAPVLSLWLMPEVASVPDRKFGSAADEGAQAGAEQQTVTGLESGEDVKLAFTAGDRLAALAKESLEYVLSKGVRPAALPPGPADGEIVLLRGGALAGLPVTSPAMRMASVPTPEEALEVLKERLRETAQRAAKDAGVLDQWAKFHEAALALAAPGLRPTIEYDKVYTAGAVERARESVEPIMREIEAGELIQEGGRRWTPQTRSDVKTYLGLLQEAEKPSQRIFTEILSHTLLVLLVFYSLYRSLPMLVPAGTRETTRLFYLAVLLMAAMVVIGRGASYFQPSGFVVPVAAVGILYAILVNGRSGAMVSCLTALLISAQYGYDWRVLFVNCAMSLAGVFSIYKVRRRGDMTAASLKALAAGLLAMLVITLAMDSIMSNTAWQRFMLVGFNGLLCVMAVPAVLSPLERLFNITTDIQLLEYSDLNNELLSRLALEVPATYSHSLMLGQLAEAAADAIGANGLLARVCAYYHDIGKMRRPEYFCENQSGVNIHDELSPRLSARAIASHVIQGAEMARQYHLPKPIVNGILEHHGTCLIGFFYQQAQQQQKHGDVLEEDFRYPGPRPQSPETAILMICDAVESGIRSIKNPNEERVREFVDKIIQARMADRQFDDCNLTFKQLDVIAQVVTRRMWSSMHTRIAYPPLREEEPQDNIIPIAGGPA